VSGRGDAADLLRRMAVEATEEKDIHDGIQPPVGESTPLAAAVATMGALPVPAGPVAPVAPLLVYRVDYDGNMPCGLYSNEAAARAHAEGVVSDEYPREALFFEWAVDEDDTAVAELDVRIGSETRHTLYTVTTLTAEHTFDPDAEW
jgi:hypothetical protein